MSKVYKTTEITSDKVYNNSWSAEIARERYRDNKGTVGHKLKTMMWSCKARCRRNNIYFDLTLDDMVEMWTDTCPVLGIRFVLDNPAIRDTSPTLDRLDPNAGYTRENCNIISARANRIKNDSTAEELLAILNWIEDMT